MEEDLHTNFETNKDPNWSDLSPRTRQLKMNQVQIDPNPTRHALKIS